MQQCLDYNKKASLKKCNQVLEQSLNDILSKTSRQKGSLQQSLSTIESELQTNLITPYCQTGSLGPCQAEALLTFLESHLVEDLYKPLLAGEIERQTRKQEEEDLEFQTIKEDLAALETDIKQRRKQAGKKQALVDQLQEQLSQQKRETQELEKRYRDLEAEVAERRKEIRHEEERQHREEAARLKAAEDDRKKREQRRIMLQKQETINRLNTEEREKRS